jgi:hypothetical protein
MTVQNDGLTVVKRLPLDSDKPLRIHCAASPFQNTGSIPSSWISWIRTTRLWHRILHFALQYQGIMHRIIHIGH